MSEDERRDLDIVVAVFFGTPLDISNRSKLEERLQLSWKLCLDLEGDKSQSPDSAPLDEIQSYLKLLESSPAKILGVYEKEKTKVPTGWPKKKCVVSLFSRTLRFWMCYSSSCRRSHREGHDHQELSPSG